VIELKPSRIQRRQDVAVIQLGKLIEILEHLLHTSGVDILEIDLTDEPDHVPYAVEGWASKVIPLNSLYGPFAIIFSGIGEAKMLVFSLQAVGPDTAHLPGELAWCRVGIDQVREVLRSIGYKKADRIITIDLRTEDHGLPLPHVAGTDLYDVHFESGSRGLTVWISDSIVQLLII
jgi:hypothetical protein